MRGSSGSFIELAGHRARRMAEMSTKRNVLEQFRREELQDFASLYELEVPDRRVRDDLIDAVARSRRAKLVEMLGTLSRDRLKEICVGLGLDDTGREKATLVERLCGEPEEEDPGVDATALLARLLPRLRITAPSKTWPIPAAYEQPSGSLRFHVYARVIGGSSRGNDLERRFQNPSQRSAIMLEAEVYPLLLGLWVEQGEDRGVVVAMDAYRRADRQTRFSMFMPLSLLEQAADTGFATHETARARRSTPFAPRISSRAICLYSLQKRSQRRATLPLPVSSAPPRHPAQTSCTFARRSGCTAHSRVSTTSHGSRWLNSWTTRFKASSTIEHSLSPQDMTDPF